MNVRIVVAALALMTATASLGCSSNQDAFQPIAYNAKPWTPPPGWNPQPPCPVGYYVAIDSCPGCSNLSYALCVGDRFTQCVCGGPFTPGTMCPQTFACGTDDFPPQNWLEFIDYAGPGWAGLSHPRDGG